MKKLQLLILITGVSIASCNKEDSILSIDITDFQDQILEIEDRAIAGSGEVSIFNAYAYAIRLNSDGSYETFDDNYGQSDYWRSWMNVFDSHGYTWTKSGFNIVLNDSLLSAIVTWEIIDIQDKRIVIKEIVDDKNLEFILFISDKQDEGTE